MCRCAACGRGWSSSSVVLLVIIFALAGWWDTIFHYLSVLDIRINAGGYFFISSILCAIWLISVLLFDRQIYMIFTPGQLRVCLDIGGGETAYDTTGMVIQKQRNDLFRHIMLGLGSGDLIVRTSGANAHEFHLPNVLFVGRKLQTGRGHATRSAGRQGKCVKSQRHQKVSGSERRDLESLVSDVRPLTALAYSFFSSICSFTGWTKWVLFLSSVSFLAWASASARLG